MTTQAETAAAITALTEKVDKINGETRALLAQIADLQQALTQAGANTNPEVIAALERLQARVDAVDALVPDTPT